MAKIPRAADHGVHPATVHRALRVAAFVPSFPELSETFILRQIVGLLERGHDVRIFAHEAGAPGPQHADVERRELMRRTRVLAVDAPAARQGGGRAAPGAFLRCLTPGMARASGGWGALVRTLGTLRGEVPFDVVHCHYGVAGLRYGVAARLWRAPLVVSFYGYDASQYPRERGERVYEPVFAAAQRVTSLSAHMDDRLRALGCPSEKLRRVPLAVDASDDDASRASSHETDAIPRLASLARNDKGAALARNDKGAALTRNDDARREVRLLTVARLVEKKGIDVALRALAEMRDERPAVRYDVIGDGPLRAELEALAVSLGIADRVRFRGPLPSDVVHEAMRDADLFVLPSLTASTGDEEGTPTVLIEAAHAGLPVLATRHAGIPDIVADGESGVLVAENDPSALADGLRAMLTTRERWPAMGDAGRRLVIERGHLTPDVAERLEALYFELLAEQEARQ
jgi:colanic acid/amylovoran biosynthesis glycosyltransferase